MRGLEQERPSCQAGASQSRLCRLENEVLGNAGGIEALDGALNRATAALLHRKNKPRLILDLDATEDPAHDKQEGMPIMVIFQEWFQPLRCCTSEGDCLGARLRPGNVHAAAGVLEFVQP